MEKTRPRISVVVLVCLAFLVPASCRRKAPSRLSGASTGEIQGALGIVHAGPRGATAGVRESDEIVVVFDHPMAPLSERPFEDSTAVFKIDPVVDGSFRWMGTRTLAFIPKVRLPYATEFKVTIPSGTRSLDGFALNGDYVWTFETLRPRLVRHLPAGDEQQLRLETEAVLVFNQPMDASKVREFVSFSGVDESGRTDQPAFDLSRPDEKTLKDADIPVPPERVVILHPRSKLQTGFSYAVELKSGLTGREGRLPLAENALFRFSTFKQFRFEGLEEEDGRDPHRALAFNFSNRVMYKEFVEKIRIEPKIEIPEYYREWDHGNTTLWVSLPLQPDTKYSLTLPADLRDDFGNALGQDESCSFTTGALAPSVSLTTGTGVVESYGDATYPLYAVNTPEVRVRAARVIPEQAIPLLNTQKIFSSRDSYMPYSGFYSYDRPLLLKLPRNERGFVPIALRDIEPDGHGFIFLEVDTYSEDEWMRYPKTFLQLTELGISGKFSPENNVIWVSALKTGEPEPGAEIE
ncbi:MAG: Ig-like domain-containing protein, partial [Candidatus Aminicenantes bacterium]|nr:Ig-like domain-containing protein [Candidatus Aminicenantes bacterium]